jgi:mono/diheme cytochrome c family protein
MSGAACTFFPQNDRIAMPSFAGGMSDQQIAALANYVRTNWGNTAAPDATSSMVVKLRVQEQGRATQQ